jgi:hypothetical protein
LLTREAFAVYLGHLKPDGVIAVHTSNRYLDLEPIVRGLAQTFDLNVITIVDNPPSEKWWVFRTTWMLVSKNHDLLNAPALQEVAEKYEPLSDAAPLWTDDHASLYDVLK